MDDLSKQPDQLIKADENTLIRYKVVEERIDIGDLKIEKRGIEEQLATVMDDAQLLEWARKQNPQPDVERLNQRLLEINELLALK